MTWTREQLTRDLTWTRETRKKRKSFGIGVYMNVSLRETGCLKKSLNGIFFSSCLRVMHIKVVFITAALLCLQRQPRKQCLIDVQALPAGRV